MGDLIVNNYNNGLGGGISGQTITYQGLEIRKEGTNKAGSPELGDKLLSGKMLDGSEANNGDFNQISANGIDVKDTQYWDNYIARFNP